MAHENLTREHRIEGSSDRAFGLVFAAVFSIVALWPLLSAASPRWWAGALGALFLAAALLKPALLSRPNRLWMRLGFWLGKLAGPIALAILFYGVLTPLSMLMRLAGKDPLRLRREAGASSYWIARQPPGPPPDSMHNQF